MHETVRQKLLSQHGLHLTRTLTAMPVRLSVASLTLAALAGMPFALSAQPTGAAQPEDVATPEAVVRVAYETVSRAPGKPFEWDRFRSLFLPGARLIPNTEQTRGTFTPHTVESFITSWITSWQAQDIDAYLAHYHPAFAPMQGTRAAWEQQRRRVIGNAADLAISTEAPQWNVAAQDGMRVVRFWLNYRAAGYADRTLKELVLAPVGSEWRIRAERNLQTEPL